MHIFTGVSASPGVVIGPVEQIDHGTTGLHRIVCDPFRERALYDVAVVLAKDELRRLSQRAKGPDADILLFQIALLEDESFTNEIGDYIAAGAGGAAAVERAEQIFARRLRDVDDEYIQERSVDVCDVCRRVVDILDGRPRRRLHLKRPSILVADRFFPSDLFSLDRRMILGWPATRTAPSATRPSWPAAWACPLCCNWVTACLPGRRQTGHSGRQPGGRHWQPDCGPGRRAYRPGDCKIALNRLHGSVADPVAAQPCLTRDGTAFRLLTMTNLYGTEDKALPLTAVGTGLLRTESVILNELSEQEQLNLLKEHLEAANGAMLAVRTCDSNADDEAPWTATVKDSLQNHRLLWPQIRALLQAAPCGDLRILFPMIAGAEDWDACLQEVTACRDELQSRGVEVDRLPPMGCIVDMPSAALLAGELIAHGAQILAIDIEDLARYTLGLVKDPAAAARRAASPAVQRLVKEVLRQAEGTGVRVYLCGITVASVDRDARLPPPRRPPLRRRTRRPPPAKKAADGRGLE